MACASSFNDATVVYIQSCEPIMIKFLPETRMVGGVAYALVVEQISQ